jgi:hypothetical protein
MKFSVPLFSQSPLTHKASIRSHGPEYKQEQLVSSTETVCDIEKKLVYITCSGEITLWCCHVHLADLQLVKIIYRGKGN